VALSGKTKMGPIELLFLLYCIHRCILVPVVAKTWARTKVYVASSPSARRSYRTLATGSILFAMMALVTAFLTQIPVFGSSRFTLKIGLIATTFLIVCMAWDRLEWRYTPAATRRSLWLLLPHGPEEISSWVVFSLVVAVCEEIVFRGVLFGVVSHATGHYWIAGIISAVFFGMYHLTYGWLSVVSIFFVALGSQWLVQLSGGLHVAIAVHFAHNAANGIIYGAMREPTYLSTKAASSAEAVISVQ
jgi:membrane protease YdiL (CAAX protease family)